MSAFEEGQKIFKDWSKKLSNVTFIRSFMFWEYAEPILKEKFSKEEVDGALRAVWSDYAWELSD